MTPMIMRDGTAIAPAAPEERRPAPVKPDTRMLLTDRQNSLYERLSARATDYFTPKYHSPFTGKLETLPTDQYGVADAQAKFCRSIDDCIAWESLIDGCELVESSRARRISALLMLGDDDLELGRIVREAAEERFIEVILNDVELSHD